MILIFTSHAKQRMFERNISLEEVKETIDFPDYTISKEGKIESYKKINNRTLKIICAKSITTSFMMWNQFGLLILDHPKILNKPHLLRCGKTQGFFDTMKKIIL